MTAPASTESKRSYWQLIKYFRFLPLELVASGGCCNNNSEIYLKEKSNRTKIPDLSYST